jgi:mgtE-like transporter
VVRLPRRPHPARRFVARLRAVVAADPSGTRQGLAALFVSSAGDLAAGLTLGSITHTLERLPGLLVLVPAAIGMRGNIFGALGSRLGTAIHTGTFRLSRRADTVVGQNVLAAATLTLAVSLALAVLAKTVAVAFGVENTISVADFVAISMVGGVLSSIVVLGLTLAVAAAAVRRNWDLDNVAAPLVTAAGDMVTLPALFAASFLVGIDVVTPVVAALSTATAVAGLVAASRARLPLLRRILAESLPVLLVAGLIDVVAGITVEKRLESFLVYPALLVMIPPFLEDTGALGGILSSRLGTKLHVGLIAPTSVPQQPARDDIVLTFLYAVPVFTLVGVSADVVAALFGLASPGVVQMIGASLLGGTIATCFAVVVAYYGAIAAYRTGLDPDNHGIPLITSSMDLAGAFSLVLALVILGIA